MAVYHLEHTTKYSACFRYGLVIPSAQLSCGDSTSCDCLCLHSSWLALELSSLYKKPSLYKGPTPQPPLPMHCPGRS